MLVQMAGKHLDQYLDFFMGKVTREEFRRSLPVDPEQDRTYVMGLLRDVIDQRDPNDAEYAVFLVNHFKLASECMDELCDLMDADWHREHEELAHIFQWARDPRATDCLSRAALSHLAYRDYDDYGALASQCMYALRAIGTSEAMHAVEKLASADDPMISQYAV